MWIAIGIVAVIVAVLVGALGAAFSRRASGVSHRASVTVGVNGNHTEIRLAGGRSSIAQVARTLAARHSPGLIVAAPGGGWELRATLVVGPQAQLSVVDTPLLLRSDETTSARIVVDGGEAQFVRTAVSSWTGSGKIDTDVSNGRADIVAKGAASSVRFDHAQVVGLGANADNPGVSISQGARGSIVDSVFEHCFRGLSADRSDALVMNHSTFVHNIEDGAFVLSPAAPVRIDKSRFASNGANGLEIDDATGAVLQSVTAHDNKVSGIVAHDDTDLQITEALTYANSSYGLGLDASTRTVVTGLRTFANSVGVQVGGGTSTLESSSVSANSADGVFVTGSSTVVTALRNRFDHNGGGALWIANGRVVARSNIFDANRTGVVVNSAVLDVTLTGNTISASSLDGMGLVSVPTTGEISGNTVSGSSKAAVSTRKKEDVSALLSANEIKPGQPGYRVRGS